ncbi:MAG: hypothetical protein VZR09_02750 [Candidatus Gastranaerophilaceae bacterium]|jgi:hypothetical protein|nr:hypothetical protein [Candidatus Gastranaerophilaceae bacterium]
MKKTLVVLLTAVFVSVGAAQAATSSTPITDWINSKTSKITKTEKQIAADKAAQEKAAKERKAAAKAKKEAIKNEINAEKTFWKKLFTWDWD